MFNISQVGTFHNILHHVHLALLLCWQEEEKCYHLADINREEELALKKHMDIEEKMLKHRFLADHLEHLNTTKAWE